MDSEAYYQAFVSMLARNGLDMGESPRTIAETAVVAPAPVGDEVTVCFSAEPFVDQPSAQTRLWPKDVITGTDRDWHSMSGETLREIAVEIVKADVYGAMMGIENDTVAGLRA